MARSYRFLASPKWLAGHLLVLAAAVSMVLLGHWQLTVSERKGFSLQNFGYALQWWLFSLFALLGWFRILHDRARPQRASAVEGPGETGMPVAYRRYVMPQSSDGPGDDVDDEQVAYNAYLASLAAPIEGHPTKRSGHE